MVLGDVLIDADGAPHKMAGLLSLQTSFAKRKRHLGYRRLTPLGGPWDVPLAAHEFHYSTVVDAKGPALFKATDAAGSTLPDMGLIQGSVMGSYAHVISTKAD
jgi:cobyrinic acid a,c-diamide synthase